jgi:NAD(P)-dependent dehydrogenase (short-subunit alcohol dehydrogenase family)
MTKFSGIEGGTYVVTAGASGIGRGAAMRIARSGGNVAILDINRQMGEEAAAEARQLGVKAIFREVDVRRRDQVAAAVAAAESELGKLKGLVAAAGISIPSPATELARADWDSVLGISLDGCFISCQEVGRRLIANGGGSIVTISSTDAFSGHSARVAYCAAKFAVAGMTKTFAIEWGRYGIRVNSVAPGITDTPAVRRGIPPEQIDNVLVDRTPVGRMGAPDDMGAACAYLLSDEARYISGVILPVDGGMTAGYFTRWQGGDLASRVLMEQGVYAQR